MDRQKMLATLAIGAMLGNELLDATQTRRVNKPKAKKCRTVEQVKRRKKNRMANKSRALNFRRAK